MLKKRLNHFGVIGNGRAHALACIDGAIEWLCIPELHGPPIFGAFGSGAQGGYFSVHPPGQFGHDWDAAQEYVNETNLLVTRFRTASGEAEITDFIPLTDGDDGPHCLFRRIHGRRGHIRLESELAPNSSFENAQPSWQIYNTHACGFNHGNQGITLLSSIALHWHEQRTTFALQENETIWLALHWTPVLASALDGTKCDQLMESTRQSWREWLNTTPLAMLTAGEQSRGSLSRILLTVATLFDRRNGFLLTAIPRSNEVQHIDRETSGVGSRASSFNVHSLYEILYRCGHEDMAEQWLAWWEHHFAKTLLPWPTEASRSDDPIADHPSAPTAPEPDESAADAYDPTLCAGYMEAHFTRSRLSGDIETHYWRRLLHLVNAAALNWREATPLADDPEGVPRHYTFNKLMWWVVLDRGIQLAERFSFPGNVDEWKTQRENLREDIIARGYDTSTGTFTSHYDTVQIDASLTALPVLGFLSVEDPRVRRTLSAIEKDLVHDNCLIKNHATPAAHDEHPVRLDYACWYAQCLTLQGRLDEAAHGLRQLQSLGSRLGLFSTTYDKAYDQLEGDFPDIRSMADYGIAIFRYIETRMRQEPMSAKPRSRSFSWLFRSAGLKPPPNDGPKDADRPDSALQVALHELRHEFYDGHYQRMEYHRIRGTRSYQRFLEAIAELQDFESTELATDDAKRGFWLNVFNASVIHGIVELGLTHSVKDVPLFYDRVQHRIGGLQFTPMDIEHGILRGNAPLPGRRRNRFSQRDNRRLLAVSQPDPRVHFALYGGNRGSPYFDVYTAERSDSLLDQAARAFINATSHADIARNTLALSQKLEWYRGDFPEGQGPFLQYLSSYFDDPEASQWLADHGRRIRLVFREYDWTLNN